MVLPRYRRSCVVCVALCSHRIFSSRFQTLHVCSLMTFAVDDAPMTKIDISFIGNGIATEVGMAIIGLTPPHVAS
jgi:hypothetical protein